MFKICSDPENMTWHMKDLRKARNASNCAGERAGLAATGRGTHGGLFAMGTVLCGNTTDFGTSF